MLFVDVSAGLGKSKEGKRRRKAGAQRRKGEVISAEFLEIPVWNEGDKGRPVIDFPSSGYSLLAAFRALFADEHSSGRRRRAAGIWLGKVIDLREEF